MLGKNYLCIGGETISNPKGLEYDYKRLETNYTTESGDEVVIVKGYPLLRLSLKFQASSRLKNKLRNYYKSGRVTTVEYKGTLYEYCFISDYSAELVENSEMTRNTEGLWDVALSIKELKHV